MEPVIISSYLISLQNTSLQTKQPLFRKGKSTGRRPRGDHLCRICNEVFLTEMRLRHHKRMHQKEEQTQRENMYKVTLKKDMNSEAALLIREY